MDGQKSPAKLSRTQSSLLRSSPTIRSSIHSLSSMSESGADYDTVDLEEQKPHSRPGPAPVRSRSARLTPGFLILFLSVYTLFAFFNRDDIPTSENLLLALIFVAILLFYVSRNRGLVNRKFNSCKKFCDQCSRKLGISSFKSRNSSKPVQWFIGDPILNKPDLYEESKCIVREGVEFYKNGEFYEGEFHKGKFNGSGVYNYSGSGRYEGDWIDGKYDGFGIENWQRGSRYRGQYSQGSRHGYGVYDFYTGDSYRGEWCNGSSHGVGVQTCADGSCFIGEFKFGVKHGLGCYHYRNGDRYAGEYFGDIMHGFGVYYFANGHRYEGSWHEGRKQGFGSYIFRTGAPECGEWNFGTLKTPLPPLSPLVLKAVEAARKTADSAIHHRRVEEQVTKAVTAANRAAHAARVAAVKAVENRKDGKFCHTNFSDNL